MKLTRLLMIIMFICSTLFAQIQKTEKPKIKLVLQLVVDQLRGDIINRHKNNFSEGGFLFLINNGMNFTNTHYLHSITKTAPGHAAIATGSIPAHNGIINNDWYDVKNSKKIYSCEDSTSMIIPNIKENIKGASPKNLFPSTLSDEISLATNGNSKVFGISLKDRGAIFLGGHLGKAFWYSKITGEFVSSKYYYEQLPEYVERWNDKKLIDDYFNSNWDLLLKDDNYQFIDSDINNHEKTLKGLGKKFPHTFDGISKERFIKLIPYTPWGDRLTFELVKEVIDNENIGKDDIVDYLSISFSCTDYIGHLFGPNTLEYEDQIINLDKVLNELFKFLDKKIGLDNILIVLTADHGVCDSPDFLKEKNIPTGVVETADFIKLCNNYGREILKLNFDLVEKHINPYIYLNERQIIKQGLKIESIENQLRQLLVNKDGIYNIYTASELSKNTFSADPIFNKVKSSFYAGRSGHIYIVSQPNWYLGVRNETRGNSAQHGSPWTYDTFVPLIFFGPNIKHGFNNKEVSPQDIAITISNFLKIKPPSASVGKVIIN